MSAPANLLDRREVVARLLADRGDLLVVSGLGSATYDTAAAGDDERLQTLARQAQAVLERLAAAIERS